MKCSPNRTLFPVLVAALAVSPPAMGTNGYFQIGYGAKSTGMAGAAIANPQDTIAAAANPAGMSRVDEGFDVGFRLFMPEREGSLDCTGVGLCNRKISRESEETLFLIPDFGYKTRIDDRWTAGVSVYGNGGMNTTYTVNIYDRTFAAIGGAPPGVDTGISHRELGVDLAQLIVAPTMTYDINENHSLGISPLLAAQKFSISGVQLFAPLSSDPGSLSNNGNDFSVGVGLRIGWLGRLHEMLDVGASYTTETYMTKFTKYDGLFADGGSFNIPAHYGVGLAVHPTPELSVALDVQRILYGDIESINNPGPTLAEFTSPGTMDPSRRLGASNGIGFGWEDIWVFKLGLRFRPDDKWTLRLGYNHGESPIPDSEVLINILAPGVVKDHVTAGISFRSSKNSEWNLSYMHAFEHSQSDPSTAFLGSAGNIKMYQNAVNFSYSRRFD